MWCNKMYVKVLTVTIIMLLEEKEKKHFLLKRQLFYQKTTFTITFMITLLGNHISQEIFET